MPQHIARDQHIDDMVKRMYHTFLLHLLVSMYMCRRPQQCFISSVILVISILKCMPVHNIPLLGISVVLRSIVELTASLQAVSVPSIYMYMSYC